WMSQTEVTDDAYHNFLAAIHPARAPMVPQDSLPASTINWFDAVEYCSWVGGRLPQSVEWEYAARAGLEGQRYITGNTLTEKDANINSDHTKPTGSYAPNRFGLFDMTGNVAEWPADPQYAYYGGFDGLPPARDTADFHYSVTPGPYVVRGGSYKSIVRDVQLHLTAAQPYDT